MGFLNNNWLIVLMMEALPWDVMEPTQVPTLATLLERATTMKTTTHISEPLPTWNAKMLTTGALGRVLTPAMLSTLAMRTRSRPTSTTMDTPSWPSMPAMMTSPTTLLESLTLAAAPASITLSWLLDGELKMELITGLSRTHGVHLGETLDFSSSREALVVTPLSVVLLNVLPVAQLMMFLKPLLLEPKLALAI